MGFKFVQARQYNGNRRLSGLMSKLVSQDRIEFVTPQSGYDRARTGITYGFPTYQFHRMVFLPINPHANPTEHMPSDPRHKTPYGVEAIKIHHSNIFEIDRIPS